MKQLPNLISGLRILMSFCLLLTPPLGVVFLVLYLLCGLSDMLDGFLARRLHAESALGSRLDSLGDFVLVCVLLWRLLPVIQPGKSILLWIAVIFLLRLAAAGVAWRRFGQGSFLHTLGNKLTGGLLFLFPLLWAFLPNMSVLFILCAVATLSAIEELLIDLTAATWNPNRKSIFHPATEVSQ